MIIKLIIAFIAGAITSYLVLRNNPKVKDKVDKITDDIDQNLD